jgi:hypothetical protein
MHVYNLVSTTWLGYSSLKLTHINMGKGIHANHLSPSKLQGKQGSLYRYKIIGTTQRIPIGITLFFFCQI